MTYVLTQIVAVILLAGLFVSTGALLERGVPRLRVVSAAVPLVRIASGMAAWIGVAFALAATGQLTWGPLTAIGVLGMVGGCVAGLRSASQWRVHSRPGVDDGRRELRNARDPGSEPWIVLLFAPAAVLAAVFILQLHPSIAFDDSVYHLTLPKLYIAAGGFREVPFNVYSHWPHNTELLYAVVMIWQDYILAKLFNWFMLVLLVIAVVRFNNAAQTRLAAGVGASLLLANFSLLWEATTAYVDIAIAFWAFMSFVLVWEYVERRATSFLVMAGICSGIAAGSKLSGIFIGCALVVVLLTDALERKSPWREWLGPTALLLGLTVLLASPWYVKGFVYTGSPAFPVGYGLLPSRIGEYEWSARLSQQFWNWHHGIGMGRRWTDYLLLPLRVSVEARPGEFGTFEGRLNPFWAGLVPIALIGSVFDQRVRRLMVFATTYFVLWASTSQQVRFLIPLLPHAACAAGLTLTMALKSIMARRGVGPSALRNRALVGIAVGLVFQGSLFWVARFHLRAVLREAPRFVANQRVTPAEVLPPVFDFINHALPSDARLMMLNTSDGFFLDRAFIADSFPQASQMADLLWRDPTAERVERAVESLGITHVVLHGRNWGIDYPQALWDFLGNDARARIVYSMRDPRYIVFQLLPARDGSP